jgi:hypothetical protein
MATLEAIQPYVEQLFDDSDVQKHLARASANLRGAKARAGKAKSTKKAIKDPTLRQRLAAGVREGYAAALAIKAGPEKQKKRSRRGRLIVLLLLGAAAAAAASPQVRGRVLALTGGGPEPGSAGQA